MTLDGISWSASRSSLPKNELESGSPPPTCGPKNGTDFGALGKRASIRISPAEPKNGSQFRSRFWSHFFTFLECTSLPLNTQNKRKTGKFLSCQQPRQPQDAARGDNDSNKIVLTRNKTLLFPTLYLFGGELHHISTETSSGFATRKAKKTAKNKSDNRREQRL